MVKKEKGSWGIRLGWLFLIELTVLALLAPTHWIDSSLRLEAQRIEQRLGTHTRQWAMQKAQSWFQASVIDSGFYRQLHHLLIPTEQERQRSKGLEDFGRGLFSWLSIRLDALMRILYQFTIRLALLGLWWPYLLLVGIPAIWEGLMIRRIKRTNFDYVSPMLHHYSIRGIALLGIGMLMVFLAPITLEPMLIPAVMIVGCLLAGLALGNIQKRI